MAEKKQPPKPAPEVPPDLELYAEVGDHVEWYPGADQSERPLGAVVSKVGMENTVVANVFDSALMGVTPQDGCRHMTDPKARLDNSGGGWRHKPLTVAARRMLLANGFLKWERTGPYQFRLVAAVPEPKAERPPTSTSAA